MRIIIAGGPHTGKTTLAAKIGAARSWPVIHTDDWATKGWSQASQTACDWIAENVERPDWILEGVATPRALRKFLAAYNDAPCDVLVYLTDHYGDLSEGQVSMGKGCATVFGEIEKELKKRGVDIKKGRQ